MKHEALKLAELGYHMIPWYNRFAPKPRPLVSGWAQSEAPDLATIDRWLAQYPKADWAILHKESVVLDIEMKNGLNGMRDLSDIQSKYNLKLITSTAVCTKSNGRHLWFRKPVNSPNKSGRIADGIEIKCCNASAHCPPSMGYSWLVSPIEANLLPVLPDEITNLWTSTSSGVAQDYDKPVFSEGERRNMLCAMAKALRHIGLREKELAAALCAINIERCTPQYPEQDVLAIAKDYMKHDIKDPVAAAMAGDTHAKQVCDILKGMGACL